MSAENRILLVEDNPAERRLAMEAFRANFSRATVYAVEDGVEALSFLRGTGKYEGSPLPNLIILDLNLPRMNGRDVIAALKDDAVLRQIPIVVLTSSHAGEDVRACYALHANCYITKPLDLDTFFNVVHDIEKLWLADAQLPNLEAPDEMRN